MAAAWRLGRKPGSTFRSTLLDDAAAGFGRHARTEAVGAGSLESAGLEGAFHWSYLIMRCQGSLAGVVCPTFEP